MDSPNRPTDPVHSTPGLGRFLADLKRRRVGRVAITYAAVAWFIVEVADTTFSMIGLPDVAGRVLIVLLLLGFPVALVLGWAFDIGPEGIERTGAVDPSAPMPARPSRGWVLVAAGAALGASLVWGVPRLQSSLGASEPLPMDVIAVLPFAVRGSSDLAYLGEGVVDLVGAVSYQPTPDQSRARNLRGALELERGDPRVGAAYLVGLDEPWSILDTYHRPLLYQLLGRHAEEVGDTSTAIDYYVRLIALWKDCDPELVPEREAIAARLAALEG